MRMMMPVTIAVALLATAPAAAQNAADNATDVTATNTTVTTTTTTNDTTNVVDVANVPAAEPMPVTTEANTAEPADTGERKDGFPWGVLGLLGLLGLIPRLRRG